MRSSALCVVAAIVLFLLTRCLYSNADDSPTEKLQRVDELFADTVGTDQPGCAVGIMREGRVIYSKGFGAASVAFGAPNSSSTAFEIASASKTFTAACIALLMDQGSISPDDEVKKFIPELQLNKPVSIRNMLRCESGIWAQFHIMPLAGWDNVPVHSPYSKEDLLTVLSGQRALPFEPGSQFQYGSGDTFLLGIVVERVSGKSLAQFAKENLFTPLGMTRTWYLEDPSLTVRNRAVGHWKRKASWASGDHSPAMQWHEWNATAFLGGGGSAVTCVDDMLRWSRIYQEDLLPRGKYINELTEQGTVLGNRFVLDVDAYLKRVNKHSDNPPAGSYRGVKRIQTTGGYWGFTACTSHFPEYDTTIVCLSNSDYVSAIGKSRQISDIILADVLAPLPEEPGNEEDIEFAVLDRQLLQQVAGAYRRKGNHPIWKFAVEGNGLILDDAFGGKIALKPLSNTRFKPTGESHFRPSAVFEFDVDGPGSAVGVTLSSIDRGLHEVLEFERVEAVTSAAPQSLEEYSGLYISDELGAIYRFRVDRAKLQLRVGSRRWETLQPLVKDEFSPIVDDPHNTRFIRFTRNSSNMVDGFSIGFWRIHGLRFDRVKLSD